MPDTVNYEEMTKDQLLGENQRLMQEREDVTRPILEKQHALNAVLDRKIAEDRLRSDVQDLSDAEREVMTALLAEPRPEPEVEAGAEVMEITSADVATMNLSGEGGEN